MPEKINTTSSRPSAFLLPTVTTHPDFENIIQAEGKNKTYLVECEAIRGLAILLVLLFHCSLRIERVSPITPNLFTSFMLAGNTGVTLFFVLSGFLLNLPFMAGVPVRPRNFFIKRALRILPMYACVVIFGTIYRHDIVAGIKALLFLNTQISALWPFGAVWWSLAVEVQFYLLLPFLHLLWRSQHWRWLLLPMLIVACYLYYEITRSNQGNYYFVHSARDSILTLWPTFLCGAILAAVHARYGVAIKNYFHDSKLFRSGFSDLFVGLLILLLAFILLEVSRIGYAKAYLFHFDHVVVEAAVWSLIIATMLYLPAYTKNIITHPILVFLGFISYSLYLLHAPVVFFGLRFLGQFSSVTKSLSLPALLGVCVAAAVALSMLTYRLIEKPMLNLKNKFSVGKMAAARK